MSKSGFSLGDECSSRGASRGGRGVGDNWVVDELGKGEGAARLGIGSAAVGIGFSTGAAGNFFPFNSSGLGGGIGAELLTLGDFVGELACLFRLPNTLNVEESWAEEKMCLEGLEGGGTGGL